jgi:hypothetical protein
MLNRIEDSWRKIILQLNAEGESTKGFLQLTSRHSSKEPSNIQLSQTSKLWLAKTNSVLLLICNFQDRIQP